MRIAWSTFQGEVPRIEPRNLGEFNAVLARGARLERGNLSPFRDEATLHEFGADRQTFVYHGGGWLGWDADVDAVPGPVATDRLYITGDGAPKMRYSGQEYALALPAPTEEPDVAIASGSVDEDIAEEVVYAYTWVTDLGEESQPSPLSARILTSPGAAVRVSGLQATPPGRRITHQRVYRSLTSASGGTELFFAVEIPASLKTVDHDPELSPLVEPIPSADFDTPPAGMKGITAMPNGMMAAFNGKELLFCEPFQPHTWPRKYRLFTDHPIVGLASFGSTLAVMTTGKPYIVQGLHPDSMAMEGSEEPHPCLSKRGIVDLGYAAAYPSSDGLVVISQSGAQNVTRTLFTREQWNALNPNTMEAGRLGGRYVFSYWQSGTGRTTGVVDLSGELPFYLRYAGGVLRAFRADDGTGRLLALRDYRDVVSVDDLEAPFRTYLWRSRPIFLPAPMSFGVVWAEGRTTHDDSPNFALRVVADGVTIRTVTEFNSIERLPAILGQEWQIEVEGDVEITQIMLAGSPSEIAGG